MNIKGKREEQLSNNQIRLYSLGATVILGLFVYAIAIKPPSVIWQINMFAFGGLETAFFWVLIFGLFWPKANKYGAIAAMGGGVIIYCLAMVLKSRCSTCTRLCLASAFPCCASSSATASAKQSMKNTAHLLPRKI